MSPYEVLEVPQTASPETIRQRYRSLAFKASQAGDEPKQRELHEAYAKLQNRTPRETIRTPDNRVITLKGLTDERIKAEIAIINKAIAVVDTMIETATVTQNNLRWREDDGRRKAQILPLDERKKQLETDAKDLESLLSC